MQTIADFRKNAINLILVPYLINIKKLRYANAFDIIKEWLNKCDSLRRLDSNFNYRIKSDERSLSVIDKEGIVST
jgi:hypothetical protein